jgi:hypothetical protein
MLLEGPQGAASVRPDLREEEIKPHPEMMPDAQTHLMLSSWSANSSSLKPN